MTHPSHNHHANNFVDTAHYVPLTGEIRASKIQGEARGYPDSVPGDPDYVGNPTGIAKPEEMRMDDRRYRKMCFPDGRYVWGDFFISIFGSFRDARGASLMGGAFYPEVANQTVRFGSFFGGSTTYTSENNPFRNVGISYYQQTSGPNGEPHYVWGARERIDNGIYVFPAELQPRTPKPPRTQIQYRARRLADVENNVVSYKNQIKYARGLNRTDIDWRPSSGGVTDYGYGYGSNRTGDSRDYYGLGQTNVNGDGPFNVPITDAGEIKFSDFRGKNRFLKTYARIGKNDAMGSSNFDTSNSDYPVHYPPTTTNWNTTILGTYSSAQGGFGNSIVPTSQGNYEFVGLFGTMQDSTASDDAYNPDGSRAYARGYVNPDFGGKLSASGITLPSARGGMRHTPTLTEGSVNHPTLGKYFKPVWASESISEPKNSATIGRYDSVTRSMPSYDYVNQGTANARPPFIANPRNGEMTHCIWYKPNLTGTGAWNGDYSLGETGYSNPAYPPMVATSSGGQFSYGLPTTWDTSSGTRGIHVLEFGVLGRHIHSGELIAAVYWDTGYRSGNMGNTGNSADTNRGGGQFVDGCNVYADLANHQGEIFYASPSADNLYFGQTVFRMSYEVYDPHSQKSAPAGWNTNGNRPFDWPAYASGSATRLIFASGNMGMGPNFGGVALPYQFEEHHHGVEV